MRALVTGATGFIGRYLVRELRAQDDEVVALVRTPGRAVALADLGCLLAEGDVSDSAAVRRALEGCDSVFHLAGASRAGEA